MKNAIALYMPALHQGCINFIRNNESRVDTVFLIGEKFVQQHDTDLAALYEKYLNAVSASQMMEALSGLNLVKDVKILDEKNLEGYDTVIIPEGEDDVVIEKILLRFYPKIVIEKQEWFIRWSRKTVLSQRAPIADAITSQDQFDLEIMTKAFTVAKKSSDWWRQVGVIIFPVNHPPIIAYNHHIPHEQAPYIHGDPRSNFKPGECIELSTAGHAEATAIAYAAKKGISLEGAIIYVTVFPCPPCAWLIKESGFSKVYYCEGYSILSASEMFKAAGISVIFVDVPK